MTIGQDCSLIGRPTPMKQLDVTTFYAQASFKQIVELQLGLLFLLFLNILQINMTLPSSFGRILN